MNKSAENEEFMLSDNSIRNFIKNADIKLADYKVYDKDLKDYYGNKFNDKKYFYNEKLKLDVYNCYENDFKFFRDNNIFFDINTID